MKFFNAAKNVVDKLAFPVACSFYFVGIPAAIIRDEIDRSKKIDEMIKAHPDARCVSDERTFRGQRFQCDHRMVDKETGEVIARPR